MFGYAALVVYEYLLTFFREFEVVKRRKWTGATLLFFLNRYLGIAYIVLENVQSSNNTVSQTLTDAPND